MLKYLAVLSMLIVISGPFGVHAELPDIKSGMPVIYLADNLDEKDKLGWCIDTKGRGFAEELHAHSCKPAGHSDTDTQFSYHVNSGQIRSVPYKNKCMTLSDPENSSRPFQLLDCEADEPLQKFIYNAESMEIQIGSDPSKCVVVGAKSMVAGPFMSRDLLYADCEVTKKTVKQWVVAEKLVEVMLADKLDEPRGYCLDIAGGKGKNAPWIRGYRLTPVIITRVQSLKIKVLMPSRSVMDSFASSTLMCACRFRL